MTFPDRYDAWPAAHGDQVMGFEPDNRVPEWVYRSEIRPPETDEEPWAVDADDIEAHPHLRSSAGWLVERWDGNRTVQPDALRADIAVLRDALRNPQALSTLESSQPTALRLLAEHAIECPDLDYDDEAAVVAAARAALAAPAPDTARPEACEFVPAHEPWSCRVHHGIRPRLDVTVCSRIVPARLESEDAAAHLAWLRDRDRLARAVHGGCTRDPFHDGPDDFDRELADAYIERIAALEAQP